MASLTVRDIDDSDIAALQKRARANNRSMSAELRALIRSVNSKPDLAALAADLSQFQEEMRRKHGAFSDSAKLIREMRESE